MAPAVAIAGLSGRFGVEPRDSGMRWQGLEVAPSPLYPLILEGLAEVAELLHQF